MNDLNDYAGTMLMGMDGLVCPCSQCCYSIIAYAMKEWYLYTRVREACARRMLCKIGLQVIK